MKTGREGEGELGGEYDGECLFNDDRDDNEYDSDNEYDNAEDGKGLRGRADDGGESDYNGRDVVRGPSFGGVGHRTSIVSPHAAAAVIHDNDDDERRCGGGALCPPLSGPSRSAGCRSSSSMLPTAVDGSGTRAFGVCSYSCWRRNVHAVVLIRKVLIQPGVDYGGKRSGLTSVGLRGRQRQAGGEGGGGAARATVTTTTATWKGGGEVEMEGGVEGGGKEGEEVC
jgi:hypothetical protein